MIHIVPADFQEVEPSAFEAFLSQCPDYYRDSYSGSTVYYFRHSKQEFAVVKGPPERVYVDPSLLTSK